MANNQYRVENKLHAADDLIDGDETITETHRKRIEPWLSAVFQSEHLNLLVGSGFSIGLSYSAGASAASMAPTSIHAAFDAQINEAAKTSAVAMGRGTPNIEDQFRAALALEAGLAVLNHEALAELRTGLKKAITSFADSIINMEAAIACQSFLDEAKYGRFHRLLTEFLLSFASRTATRDRLHIFTTNYDRVIEHGLDLIGARPIDRFVGALTPQFRASRFDVDIHYSPPGGRADARPLEGVVRYTKLHGSVDWRASGRSIRRHAIPFGGPSPFRSDVSDQSDDLMIFPNSAKDIETAFFPYADLFRDFSAAICRPNAALVTYGYGFGDDHINRIIRDMLTLPSTHLVIISFSDEGDRIERFLRACNKPAQVTTIIGPQLAALDPLVDHFLPKPAIDAITSRKADLLSRRGDAAEQKQLNSGGQQ